MERNVSIDHLTQECGCNPLYTTRAFAIAGPLPGTRKKKKKKDVVVMSQMGILKSLP